MIWPPAGAGVAVSDSSGANGRAVGDQSMAVDSLQDHRPVGTIESRSAAVGYFFSGQSSWFHPAPRIQPLPGCAAA